MAYRSKFPFVDADLEKNLEEAGFSSSSPGRRVLRLSSDGQESVALRWTSSGSEVYYDPTRAFLSAEGSVPEGVHEAFGKLVKIAAALLGPTWATELKWTELYATIRILGERKPLESYTETYSPKIIERVGKILGTTVKPFLFAVFSSPGGEEGQPLNEIPNWVTIVVEPFIQNPKYYFMKLVFRQQDTEKVVGFASRLEKIVGGIISEIEGR